MYGYVRIHAPELKVREHEYYRAVYCGLCRTMGKCTGQCSRMTLSYDITYFALVRMALTGKHPVIKARRCPVHPLRKRPMAEPTDDLALCAYMSAILAHHKVRDDLRDEQGMKRTVATAVAPFVGSFRRRAIKKGYGEADSAVADAMHTLCELEAARPPSVDEPADLFGELMALLLAEGLTGNREKLARKIGRHVGRWVYILDAADDFTEDMKKGRYNPLACLYADWLSTDPNVTELPSDKREELKIALLNELAELECALDLLDIEEGSDVAGILRNILYLGMPREIDRVLFGETGGCAHDSENSTKRGHRRRKGH